MVAAPARTATTLVGDETGSAAFGPLAQPRCPVSKLPPETGYTQQLSRGVEQPGSSLGS